MTRDSTRTVAGELPLAALVLILAPVWGSGSLSAQEDWSAAFEVRAGATYSSPLAESPVRLNPGAQPPYPDVESVELGAAVAPYVGAGVLFDVGHLLWAELQTGFSFASVRAEGPGGEWDAGSMTRFHATGGLRVGLGQGLYVRGAVGFLVQSASDVTLFTEGDDTGILLSAAAGYQPVETLPLSLEVEAQRFDFGTTALRRAGAPDGSVGRIMAALAWRLGSGEGE